MKFIRTLWLLMTVSLSIPAALNAQKTLLPLSPLLKSKDPHYFTDSVNKKTFLFQVQKGYQFQELPKSFEVIYRRDDILVVRSTPFSFLHQLASVKGLLFADENASPVTEGGVINYDMSVNRVNAVWNKFPSLTGAGSIVSVKEDRMDTNDIDLLGRYVSSAAASPRGSTHATVMATLISGAGNSYYTGKGVAFQSRYSSSDFAIVLPDTPTYYSQAGIHIQNHSYGVGLQNYYGINARAFDLSQNTDSTLQHIFSAGNSGTTTGSTGPYAGIPAYANITGNMKMAKNVLVAGAVDSSGKIAPLSSRGPAYDGRIKPELVAYGDDGSSGAAAIVSGTCLLLREAFNRYQPGSPPSWLLRSILINGAADIGAAGPDFETGYGLLDALASIQTVTDNRFFTGQAVQGSENIFLIDIPAGSRNLRVTLSWNDTAAIPGAAKALINDIDMEIIHQGSATTWLPWVLNIYPAADSLRKQAIRAVDTLNNNEQVTIENLLPGQYQVRIKGTKISSGPVPFAVSYRWEKMDTFSWSFPLHDDPVPAGSSIFAKWTASFSPGARAELQWSFDSGTTWSTISDTILLERQQYEVRIPGIFSTAIFRMITPAGNFISDEFLISPVMSIRFGFACDSNVLTYWNKVSTSTQYHVYQLSNNLMTGRLFTTDTSAILAASGSPYFSVAPVSGSREGFRSPSLSYQLLGTGCYINNFLADLVNTNNAQLQLVIGSVYKVKQVSILKISRNNEVIFSTSQPLVTTYTAQDMKLEKGLNQYQAIVTLDDGRIISSGIETVYFLDNTSHIIFPNPVPAGGRLFLLSDFPVEGEGVVYDAWGRKMMQFTIEEKQQQIQVNRLTPGMYYLVIFQQGKLVSRIPFMVQ